MFQLFQRSLLLLLLAAPAAGQANTDCSAWGSEEFWQEARASDVTRCFGGNAASIDINARDDSRSCGGASAATSAACYGRGRTPLHQAALWARTENIVNAMIAEGANVNVQDQSGWAPLHLAARNGKTEAVNALLAAGAEINARDNGGQTPLHWAADDGTAEAVNALIAAGAEINARDRKGKTPLHQAALRARAEAVKALLAAGADIHARAERAGGNFTPLDYAERSLSWGRTETVNALVAAGADIHARNDRGATPGYAQRASDCVDFHRQLNYNASMVAVTFSNSCENSLLLDDAGVPNDRDRISLPPYGKITRIYSDIRAWLLVCAEFVDTVNIGFERCNGHFSSVRISPQTR